MSKLNSIDIQDVVEEFFDVQLNSKYRGRPLVDARKIYAYLCRKYTEDTLRVIGARINVNYCSILYYCGEVEQHLETDLKFRDKYVMVENFIIQDNRNYQLGKLMKSIGDFAHIYYEGNVLKLLEDLYAKSKNKLQKIS